MKLDLKIAFRDMAHSDAIEADVRRHVEKLEQVCDEIMACRVTVEAAAKHKHQGKLFAVHLDVTVPGGEIASTRHHEHEDVHVALRDAFDAVKRRLEDHVRKRRGQTKQHEVPVQGRVVRLFDAGYGFIEDADGNEYYFDRANLVHPSFELLEVGAGVEFLSETAGEGLQAKRVTATRQPVQ